MTNVDPNAEQLDASEERSETADMGTDDDLDFDDSDFDDLDDEGFGHPATFGQSGPNGMDSLAGLLGSPPAGFGSDAAMGGRDDAFGPIQGALPIWDGAGMHSGEGYRYHVERISDVGVPETMGHYPIELTEEAFIAARLEASGGDPNKVRGAYRFHVLDAHGAHHTPRNKPILKNIPLDHPYLGRLLREASASAPAGAASNRGFGFGSSIPDQAWELMRDERESANQRIAQVQEEALRAQEAVRAERNNIDAARIALTEDHTNKVLEIVGKQVEAGEDRQRAWYESQAAREERRQAEEQRQWDRRMQEERERAAAERSRLQAEAQARIEQERQAAQREAARQREHMTLMVSMIEKSSKATTDMLMTLTQMRQADMTAAAQRAEKDLAERRLALQQEQQRQAAHARAMLNVQMQALAAKSPESGMQGLMQQLQMMKELQAVMGGEGDSADRGVMTRLLDIGEVVAKTALTAPSGVPWGQAPGVPQLTEVPQPGQIPAQPTPQLAPEPMTAGMAYPAQGMTPADFGLLPQQGPAEQPQGIPAFGQAPMGFEPAPQAAPQPAQPAQPTGEEMIAAMPLEEKKLARRTLRQLAQALEERDEDQWLGLVKEALTAQPVAARYLAWRKLKPALYDTGADPALVERVVATVKEAQGLGLPYVDQLEIE